MNKNILRTIFVSAWIMLMGIKASFISDEGFVWLVLFLVILNGFVIFSEIRKKQKHTVKGDKIASETDKAEKLAQSCTVTLERPDSGGGSITIGLNGKDIEVLPAGKWVTFETNMVENIVACNGNWNTPLLTFRAESGGKLHYVLTFSTLSRHMDEGEQIRDTETDTKVKESMSKTVTAEKLAQRCTVTLVCPPQLSLGGGHIAISLNGKDVGALASGDCFVFQTDSVENSLTYDGNWDQPLLTFHAESGDSLRFKLKHDGVLTFVPESFEVAVANDKKKGIIAFVVSVIVTSLILFGILMRFRSIVPLSSMGIAIVILSAILGIIPFLAILYANAKSRHARNEKDRCRASRIRRTATVWNLWMIVLPILTLFAVLLLGRQLE